MRPLSTLAILLFINFFLSAQSTKKEIAVYLGAGVFTDRKLSHVSGNYKLEAIRSEFNLEGGFRLRRSVSTRFFLQSGLSFNMHMQHFNAYAVKNANGSSLNAVEVRKPEPDIGSFSLFIPLQFGYVISENKKWLVEFLLGPGLSLYLEEERYVPNYNRYEGIDDPFYTYQVKFLYKKSRELYPALEAESEIRTFKYFKRKGKIGIGMIYHLGNHGFERSTYIIFPSLPDKTSIGKLSSGRSYLGMKVYYGFGGRSNGH